MQSVGENVEKLEPLYIASRSVKPCSLWGKKYDGSSKD